MAQGNRGRKAGDKGLQPTWPWRRAFLLRRLVCRSYRPRVCLAPTNLNKKSFDGEKPFEIMENPWDPGDPVVLLPALAPDVSIVHAQKADEMGNVVVGGIHHARTRDDEGIEGCNR